MVTSVAEATASCSDERCTEGSQRRSGIAVYASVVVRRETPWPRRRPATIGPEEPTRVVTVVGRGIIGGRRQSPPVLELDDPDRDAVAQGEQLGVLPRTKHNQEILRCVAGDSESIGEDVVVIDELPADLIWGDGRPDATDERDQGQRQCVLILVDRCRPRDDGQLGCRPTSSTLQGRRAGDLVGDDGGGPTKVGAWRSGDEPWRPRWGGIEVSWPVEQE